MIFIEGMCVVALATVVITICASIVQGPKTNFNGFRSKSIFSRHT